MAGINRPGAVPNIIRGVGSVAQIGFPGGASLAAEVVAAEGYAEAAAEAQAAAEAARDEALAHTEPLTAPANSQVASYVANDGATKTALAASTDGAIKTTADIKTRRIAPWQPNHAYAVGDQFITDFVEVAGVNFTDVSHRRWQVGTAYTSGSAFSATDTAKAFVLRPDGTPADTSSWAFFEQGHGGQGQRVRTNQAMWVLPDKTYATDALYARKGDPAFSSLELEGAVEGPGSGRVMGVVVWDNPAGTLVYTLNDKGDVILGAQRHLLSGPGSGTSAATIPTLSTPGPDAGTSTPDPVLADATDIRGTVYFGTGSGAAAGRLVRVTFARPFDVKPHILVGPANGNSPGLGLFVDWANDVDLNGFYVRATGGVAPGQPAGAYAFSYHVIG